MTITMANFIYLSRPGYPVMCLTPTEYTEVPLDKLAHSKVTDNREVAEKWNRGHEGIVGFSMALIT